MKVITLSKNFMKSHFQAGQATWFKTAFLEGRKIHTIRQNAKNYFKEGDELSVRQWTDRPYASKQVEIGQRRIGIEPVLMTADNGNILICQVSGTDIDWLEIANHDGLSKSDFFDWFFPNGSGSFYGDVLHFTDFRYSILQNSTHAWEIKR